MTFKLRWDQLSSADLQDRQCSGTVVMSPIVCSKSIREERDEWKPSVLFDKSQKYLKGWNNFIKCNYTFLNVMSFIWVENVPSSMLTIAIFPLDVNNKNSGKKYLKNWQIPQLRRKFYLTEATFFLRRNSVDFYHLEGWN